MKEFFSPDTWQWLGGTFITIGGAILGRLGWHARLAQKGERRFWSKHLFFELIIAIGIGYVANGVTAYFGFAGEEKLAGIITIAYLGPSGIMHLAGRYFSKTKDVK